MSTSKRCALAGGRHRQLLLPEFRLRGSAGNQRMPITNNECTKAERADSIVHVLFPVSLGAGQPLLDFHGPANLAADTPPVYRNSIRLNTYAHNAVV